MFFYTYSQYLLIEMFVFMKKKALLLFNPNGNLKNNFNPNITG